MENVWTQLWDILWSMLVAAVSLNWPGVQARWADFLDWWDNLWWLITERLQDLWDALTNLGDYVSHIMSMVYDHVSYVWIEIETWVLGQIDLVATAIWAEITSVLTLIDSGIETVRQWVLDQLAGILDSALAFIMPYVDAVSQWVTDNFGWVLDYYYLIVHWLNSVKDAIDWFVLEAWGQLQAFLADPVGFIGGAILEPVTEIINWWSEWGDFLVDFVTDDLAALRNLLAAGLSFLQTFVDNPLQTILDLLYPAFLDWLENLIAENW